MSLKSLSYSEFEGSAENWVFEKCEFSPINLVVGKNSTGKSRLISIISGFCDILNSRIKDIYKEGNFLGSVEIDNEIYEIKIHFKNGSVVHESLRVDGTDLLVRNENGSGRIFYVEEGVMIGFKMASDSLAFQQKQDELQHPFLAKVAKWASGAETYLFNKSFSNNAAVVLSNLLNGANKKNVGDGADVVRTYTVAYERFGDDFDAAVISDMALLGYNLKYVHAQDVRKYVHGLEFSEPLIGFVVHDIDIGIDIPQMKMSQGMYRALCVVIEMNIVSFGKEKTIILIDDIGEGLDFERSVALIDIIVRHAESAKCQIFMTSNDRFVMNKIPLKYWMLLQRRKCVVSAYTEKTNPVEFDDFKYMGLSNFDFFTSTKFGE